MIRNALHHDSHLLSNTNHDSSVSPINPAPFHRSHDPQPQARRNAPPPPVPQKNQNKTKRGITKSISTSNETLQRIDAITKPLKKSYSPPVNPRSSRSFTVVETRHLEVCNIVANNKKLKLEDIWNSSKLTFFMNLFGVLFCIIDFIYINQIIYKYLY